MTQQDMSVKTKISHWLNDYLYRCRRAGKALNRNDLASILGCTASCLSQYTNQANPKKVPWEFQSKVCLLVGKSIIQLHPELEDIRSRHF